MVSSHRDHYNAILTYVTGRIIGSLDLKRSQLDSTLLKWIMRYHIIR